MALNQNDSRTGCLKKYYSDKVLVIILLDFIYVLLLIVLGIKI